MSNTVSKTALISSNVFSNLTHCPMMGDELLLKRSPDRYQKLDTINCIYHVKYSARNSFDKLERIQQFNSLPDDGRRASPET